MKNKVSSVTDLIIGLVCMTGEMQLKQCLNDKGLLMAYKKSYIEKSVREMIGDKLVRKYKSDDGEEYLRLCFPKGEKRAKEISPELYFHYCLLAGKSSIDNAVDIEKAPMRFTGGFGREHRRQLTSQIIYKLNTHEIKTDFIGLEIEEKKDVFDKALANEFDMSGIIKPLSIFDEYGEKVEKKYFMNKLDPAQPNFILNRALVLRDQDHVRSDMTKTIGMLFQNERGFLVYYYDDIKFRWNVNCEMIMSGVYQRDIVGFPLENSLDGIFFVKDMKSLMEILSPRKTEKGKGEGRIMCMPNAVFPQSYFFPINEDSEPIIDILLSKEGEVGFNLTEFEDDYVGEDDETAKHGNVFYYNLAFLNYNKLKKAKLKRARTNGVAACIMSWQKDAIIKYLEYTPEEAEKLIYIIDDEVKEHASDMTGKEYF